MKWVLKNRPWWLITYCMCSRYMVQRYGITLHLNCSRRHEMHKILALKGTRGPLVKVIVEWSVFFLPLSWFQQYLLECPHFKITAYDMQQRSSVGSIWGCCTQYRVCTLTAGPAGQPHRLFAWTYFKLWQSRVLAFFFAWSSCGCSHQ